jgi:DNA-binding response OmpR family regulator
MTFTKKILLIDHDPAVTRRVREALERTGRYCVREEHDEHAAGRVAQFFQPDLILLDFMTSAMEALMLSREMRRDTPVLCMKTLGASNQLASAGVMAGYTFFAGPLQTDQLVRGIEQMLGAG